MDTSKDSPKRTYGAVAKRYSPFLLQVSLLPLRHFPHFKMSRYLLLYLFLTSAASVAGLSDCYLPNGTALPLSSAYEPCIATENVFSMCCVLNVTALEALGFTEARLDTCLPNGMCQAPASVGGFARDMCTDPTWKSPNCLNICVGGSVSPVFSSSPNLRLTIQGGGTAEDASALTQCTDGSWCCGSKNTACCNNNQGFQVAKAIPPYVVADASSTGTATSSPTGTSSPAQNTQNSISTNPPVKASSNGAEIGLGAALGVILLAAVVVGVYFFFKRRGIRRGRVELVGDSKLAYPMTPIQRGGSNATNRYGQEESTYQSPQSQRNQAMTPRELGYGPGGASVAEMDGGGGKHAGML